MQANIVLESLSEDNEMGIYATMRTVQTDAKLVDRICNQSPAPEPKGTCCLSEIRGKAGKPQRMQPRFTDILL